MKKIGIMLSLSVLTLVFLSACTSKDSDETTDIVENPIIDIVEDAIDIVIEEDNTENVDEVTEEVTKTTLSEMLFLFNSVYKKVLLATGQEKEESIDLMKETTDLRTSIKVDSLDTSEFTQEDLAERLSYIGDYVNKAQELVDQNDLVAAHEELETVRKEIMSLRQENNIKNISDDMLVFHDIMEELVATDIKNEVLLLELTGAIIPLKEYNPENTSYQELITNLETIITELKTADEVTYKTKITELKPTFIKLYIAFG